MDISKITYAFAAMVESLYQITLISHSGVINKGTVDPLLKGVLKTESMLSTNIYPLASLKNGLTFFTDKSLGEQALKEINYYIPNIFRLATVYLGRRQERDDLEKQIGRIKELLSHQENKSLFVAKHLAEWYATEISQTNIFALQIFGAKEHLGKDVNLIYIRALLVSALRACILWKQLGGNQMNFVFNRSKMIISARQMLEVI